MEGQHLLQMLVNLLARQFGVVKTVMLDFEDCAVHAGVFLCPRITDGDLLTALVQLGEAVGNGLTSTRISECDEPPSVVVCVGPDLDPAACGVPAIAIAGYGWRAQARTTGPIDRGSIGTTPFGAQVAGCVAAAFAFKSAYGKHGSVDQEFDLWPGDDEEGPSLAGITLPPAYVLGLGAVGAAFSYSLAATTAITGTLIGIDPQAMADTDRNRLLSGSWGQVGHHKAELFHELFKASPINVHPFKGRWPDDYFGIPKRDIPQDLREQERQGLTEWVVSCVDRNRDRFDIASRLPRHVLAGSTLGLAAQTAYYSLDGECECLACRHRPPHQLGVEELAEQLGQLSAGARSVWYDEYGATRQARASIEEYLSDPTCAGPGEADLAKLGLQGRVDWAVGFVSAAAGVVLAARFVRASLVGVAQEMAAGSELRLLFWSSELRRSQAHRASDCPLCSAVPLE